MFLFLSKFLPQFVYPLGLAISMICIALLVFRRPSLQRVFLILAIVLLFFGGNRWVAMALARSLEWRYLPPDPVPNAEAIVLLGGGTLSADYPRPIVELNAAGDRVLYAAWLYHQGKAPAILLSGGTIGWTPDKFTPADQMAVILELMGVPKDDMWLEVKSRNTYENALFSAEILGERSIERVLLVTSASHMPRSVALFEAQGIEVIPLPTDFIVTQADWRMLEEATWEAKIMNFIPNADNLAVTSRMLKEYIGIFVYRLRGWL